MVNLFKVIAHIKKVGWKEFRREYGEKKEEVAQDPLTALRMQSLGYKGALLFQLISAIFFFWHKIWYVGGIFVFYCLVTGGQMLSNRNQIKLFEGVKIEEQKLIEEAEKV